MLITPPVHVASQTPQFVQMARAREVDGVLVVGVVDGRWVLEAMDAGTPVVLLDHWFHDLPIPAVVNDNVGGAYRATRYLAALGHTRIGLVGAAVDYPLGRESHEGHLRALVEMGLPRDPDLEILIPIDAEIARQRTPKFFTLAKPPTAIVAVTDFQALGVVRGARELGLAIPEDLSVIGMDDIDLATVTDPPLTTVRVQKEEMGRRAAHMLLDLIKGHTVDPGVVILPNEIVVRGTTTTHVGESSEHGTQS